jgi:hypothetical protein
MSLSKVFVAEKVIASSTSPEKAVSSPVKRIMRRKEREKQLRANRELRSSQAGSQRIYIQAPPSPPGDAHPGAQPAPNILGMRFTGKIHCL